METKVETERGSVARGGNEWDWRAEAVKVADKTRRVSDGRMRDPSCAAGVDKKQGTLHFYGAAKKRRDQRDAKGHVSTIYRHGRQGLDILRKHVGIT